MDTHDGAAIRAAVASALQAGATPAEILAMVGDALTPSIQTPETPVAATNEGAPTSHPGPGPGPDDTTSRRQAALQIGVDIRTLAAIIERGELPLDEHGRLLATPVHDYAGAARELMTVTEAASRLGVTRQQAYRLLDDPSSLLEAGTLPSGRIGVSRQSVEAELERRRGRH